MLIIVVGVFIKEFKFFDEQRYEEMIKRFVLIYIKIVKMFC